MSGRKMEQMTRFLVVAGRCGDAVGDHHASSGHWHNHKRLGHHVCHIPAGVWFWSGRSAFQTVSLASAALYHCTAAATAALSRACCPETAVCRSCSVPATRRNKCANQRRPCMDADVNLLAQLNVPDSLHYLGCVLTQALHRE